MQAQALVSEVMQVNRCLGVRYKGQFPDRGVVRCA